MQKGLIGKKLGMTQLFDANGNVVPVTVIEAGPCVVAQKKTVENDGYDAIQVGYGDLKASKVNGPMKGHFAKNDVAPKKVLREFRLDDCAAVNVGDVLKADIFAEGDSVDVRGTSKGKGYAGVIKRWNFSRLKESHGTGPVHRHGGSLGVIDPARVFKGKKMVTRELLFRISKLLKSTQKTTSSLLRVPFPAPRAESLFSSTALKLKEGECL